MNPDDPRHGTYAGYQAHKKTNQEQPCEPCRIAYNAYQRERRKSDPTALRRSRQSIAAATRALWRLKADHPTEYAALYAEELGKQKAGAR